MRDLYFGYMMRFDDDGELQCGIDTKEWMVIETEYIGRNPNPSEILFYGVIPGSRCCGLVFEHVDLVDIVDDPGFEPVAVRYVEGNVYEIVFDGGERFLGSMCTFAKIHNSDSFHRFVLRQRI